MHLKFLAGSGVGVGIDKIPIPFSILFKRLDSLSILLAIRFKKGRIA